MSISRGKKESIISNLQKKLAENVQIILVLENLGLTVAEGDSVRAKVREFEGKCVVVKNSLAKLAVKGTSFEPISDVLTGPTMLAMASGPVALSKVFVECDKKKGSVLKIKGGIFEGEKIDINGIKKLAELPSLQELQAGIIALVSTPATNIVMILSEPGSRVARVLAAKE